VSSDVAPGGLFHEGLALTKTLEELIVGKNGEAAESLVRKVTEVANCYEGSNAVVREPSLSVLIVQRPITLRSVGELESLCAVRSAMAKRKGR
jgi:hypothetical protein